MWIKRRKERNIKEVEYKKKRRSGGIIEVDGQDKNKVECELKEEEEKEKRKVKIKSNWERKGGGEEEIKEGVEEA